MRETQFIKQNKEKWTEFEEVLKKGKSDPEKLSELFIQVTDDLSYARTFYQNRSVRVYLNGLAQRTFLSVYKNKSQAWKTIKEFWSIELPAVSWHSRKDMLLSFCVFMISVLIGAFSTSMDPDFPRSILGDGYVEMTIENIQKGDPMAVYKQEGSLSMFLGISTNNLRVTLLAFALGAFFGIGTLSVLMFNGIMLGAFQYFFYQQQELLSAKGLFWESFLTIWIHGAIEISCIVVAGAAGLALGRALVFPGTYSRINSFLIASRRGLKLLIGIAPLIILAGFFEGYLTRHTDTPNLIRALFIFASFAFMYFYFVWLPRKRYQAGLVPPQEEEKLPPDSFKEIDFTAVKTNGELFQEVIPFVKRNLGLLGVGILFSALSVSLIISELYYDQLFTDTIRLTGTSIIGELFILLFDSFRIFYFKGIPGLYATVVAAWSVIICICVFLLVRMSNPELVNGKSLVGRVLFIAGRIVVPCLILHSIFFLSFMVPNEWLSLILIFTYPFFMMVLMSGALQGNYIKAVRTSVGIISSSAVVSFGLFLLFLLLGLVVFLFFNAPLLFFYLDFLTSFFKFEGEFGNWFFRFLELFISCLAMFFSLSFIGVGLGLSYYSFYEKLTAASLKEKISLVGNE